MKYSLNFNSKRRRIRITTSNKLKIIIQKIMSKMNKSILMKIKIDYLII